MSGTLDDRIVPDITYVVNETIKRLQNSENAEGNWYGLLLHMAEQYTTKKRTVLEKEMLTKFVDAYHYFRTEKDLERKRAEYLAVSSIANHYKPIEERYVEF